MIRVRRATIEDIDAAANNLLPIFGYFPNVTEGCKHSLEYGWMYALVDRDENLCGVVGGFPIWGGVASLGALFTPHLLKHPVSAIRVVRKLLDDGMKEHNLHRVEIAVQDNYRAGLRYAKALGFEPEGILRKYGPDQTDHVMFGRI